MGRPKLFDFTSAELELEFQQTAKRVMAGEDLVDPRPAFDPKQAAEVAAEQAGGRRAEMYEKALEHHGFLFVPARRLPRMRVGNLAVAHQEGKWIHERLGFAYYPSDLPKQFPEGPEQLDKWLTTEKKLRKLVNLQAPRSVRQKLLQK